jgi:hypothetical protein
MLNKIIVSLLSLTAILFVFAGSANAASISVKLQQPANQMGQSNFDLTFVALSTDPTLPITVQCEKKGPGDSDFVSFGSPIVLSNGGNTDKCHTDSGIVNQSGQSYSFRVLANGTPSNVVSVDYNSDSPGVPGGYNKTKTDACTYRISFHTADDSGKTVKVVLYRSTNPNFTMDNGTKINSIDIGSNVDGHMDDNISPDCNTNYYYAIRAFSAFGNASGVTGDSSTQTVNSNVTGAPAQGAIPVVQLAKANKEVLGQATQSAKPTPVVAKPNVVIGSVNWVVNHKKISLAILVILIGLISYYLYRKGKKK